MSKTNQKTPPAFNPSSNDFLIGEKIGACVDLLFQEVISDEIMIICPNVGTQNYCSECSLSTTVT